MENLRVRYTMHEPSQSNPLSPRLARELKTITAMVTIYCRDHHSCPDRDLCEQCSDFLAYAQQRLAHCPFKEHKPTCGNCPIHCYKNQMQTMAREIMRYSGPKMLWHHPILACFHLLDGRRKVTNPRSPHHTQRDKEPEHRRTRDE